MCNERHIKEQYNISYERDVIKKNEAKAQQFQLIENVVLPKLINVGIYR